MSRIHFTFYSVPSAADIAVLNAWASAFAHPQQNNNTAAQNQQPQPQAQQQQTPSFNFFFMPVFGVPPTAQQGGFNFEDFLNQTFQAAQQQKTGPPPTKKDALECLPTFKFTEKLEQSLRRQQQFQSENICTCAVCQCDFERNDTLVRLPCQHIYHKDCIEPWLKEHNTCACCRFELPVDDSKEEAERRKRMAQRYTEQGFKIIEIASTVDSMCCKTEDILDEIKTLTSSPTLDEEQRRRLKHLEFELNKFDASLMQNLLSLDSIDNLSDNKLKDQKKQQIIKIQETLSALDEARKVLTERKAQETSCSSAPVATSEVSTSSAANSEEDNMELC